MDGFLKRVADEVHLFHCQGGIHWQGNLVVGDILCLWEYDAKFLVGGEPVGGRIMDRSLDAGSMHIVADLVAPFLCGVEQHHGEDVVAGELCVVGKRDGNALHLAKSVNVTLTNIDTSLQVARQLLQLFDGDGCPDVIHTEVIT